MAVSRPIRGQQTAWQGWKSPWLLACALCFLMGMYVRQGVNTVSTLVEGRRLGSHHNHGAGHAASQRAVEQEEEDEEEDEEPGAVAQTVAERGLSLKQAASSSSASDAALAKSSSFRHHASTALAGKKEPAKPAGSPIKATFASGDEVMVYPRIQPNGEEWWKTLKSWEMDSQNIIKYFLTTGKAEGKTVHIDFGCWVGPTILEAARYADEVYAMEPDFMAYQEAYWNVKLNPDRAAKIDLRNLCISDAPGSLTMYGAPGASMSSMHPTENQKSLPGFTSWTIDCMTLDAFVGNQGIDPASIALIKMDTEGHERALLKQLQPWLLKHKPTMLLSMHAYTFPDDTVAHEQIKKLIFSYKTALLSDGRKLDPATFSVAGWCRLCALVLTEEELPAGVDSWEKIFKPQAA